MDSGPVSGYGVTFLRGNVGRAEAGNHKGCPYDGLAGGYFDANPLCRVPPTPPTMEMAGAIRESPLREVGRGMDSGPVSGYGVTFLRGNDGRAEAGNHKGCPYDGFGGGYFDANPLWRLSPTPPTMEMAGANRESPLWEVGGVWIPAPYRGTG